MEKIFEQPLHVGRPNIKNRDKFMQSLEEIMDNQWLTNDGPTVQELEATIARYLGVKHCVAMCNGTIALEIAIRALDLTGEVIVPSWTFVATAHALYWQGITPVFADINPETHNLDPESVRRMITPRTTGIIGVHLWGRAAPIEELQKIAEEHNLKLLFDAAHAFGSSYRGQSIGNFGSCEIFSFHATKSFNTMEGGAVVTNDDDLAEKIRLMRNFGFNGYDNVIHPGTNGKMIEVCAAMGLANLDGFNETIETNKNNYTLYKEILDDLTGIKIINYPSNERNSYHYVVAEVTKNCPVERDELIKILHENNILARKYFWPGCHGMKPYQELYPHAKLVLPNTIDVAERVMVLPSGTATLPKQIEAICQIIVAAIKS